MSEEEKIILLEIKREVEKELNFEDSYHTEDHTSKKYETGNIKLEINDSWYYM